MAASVTRSMTTRLGRPSVRTTFQFAASISQPAEQSADDTLIDARTIVLDWLERKFPATLPTAARVGQSFTADEYGQVIQCVSIADIGQWCARLSHPDAPSPRGDRDAVAGRTWTTDIALAADGGRVWVAIRVLCASLRYTQAPFLRTRPRVVIDLAKRFTMMDVRPITAEPWRLEREEDLTALLALLTDQSRSLPVYMLTQPDPHRLGINVNPYLLDEVHLARKLQGVGHVVTMPRDMNPVWTMMVGKTWSAFMGAVRTYKPRLDFYQDAPISHPLALPDRILAFDRKGKIAEEAFTSFLVDQAFLYISTKPIDWMPCLFYADALQRESEIARTRAKDDQVGNKQHYEKEIAALRKQAEEADGLAESYADDVNSLNVKLDEAKDDNRKLSNYIEVLRTQVKAKTGKSADAAIVIPEDYDNLPEWVEVNLAGRLLLHPRAERELKGAVYQDVGLVYRALLALGAEYRNMRLRDPDDDSPKRAWEHKIAELGLECEESITRERAGEQRKKYIVKYPLGTKNNKFLKYHLRKGKAREERFCLAIYFFWDGHKKCVVVGALPRHLDNRMT